MSVEVRFYPHYRRYFGLFNEKGSISDIMAVSYTHLAGYTKDRYISENKFLKEEKKALEERYIFLSKLYEESLANKGEFKNQILTYRDSFGRIFEITRRLNSVVPEVIFSEALGALEDILQNQTISIYTVTPDGYYGRLVVCSQKISRITAKSLKLEDYKEMLETLREGEVWSNTGHLPDYPEYCLSLIHISFYFLDALLNL